MLLEGSWRGEAPYKLQVGGDGLGDRAKPFPPGIEVNETGGEGEALFPRKFRGVGRAKRTPPCHHGAKVTYCRALSYTIP